MNIIAYGSLMNQSSLGKTLERPTKLTKIIIPGYRRIFNAPFGEYAFLNIEPAPGNSIEAAYFTMNEGEFSKFAEREAGAEVIEVMPGYVAFVWPQKLCQDLPVLQSYIEVCAAGAKEIGVNMMLGISWPEWILDDTNSPLYPEK